MAAWVEMINTETGERKRMYTIDAKEMLSGKGAEKWQPYDPDAEARRTAQREAAAAVKAAVEPEDDRDPEPNEGEGQDSGRGHGFDPLA